MKLISKLTSFFDATINLLALLGAVILVFTLLVVNYEVVARYVLNQPSAWELEVVEYSLLYLAFLGAAWVLRNDGHIRMDLVLNRLEPRVQVWLNIITSLIGAIICFIITWYGVKVTWDHFQAGLYFAAYLKPPKYIILAIVPVGCFLLSIQFLRMTYGYIRSWRELPEQIKI